MELPVDAGLCPCWQLEGIYQRPCLHSEYRNPKYGYMSVYAMCPGALDPVGMMLVRCGHNNHLHGCQRVHAPTYYILTLSLKVWTLESLYGQVCTISEVFLSRCFGSDPKVVPNLSY